MSRTVDPSIIYSHYDDSHRIVRSLEQQRNRLFFFLLIVIGALSLQLGYAVKITDVVSTARVPHAALDLERIPTSALLSSTWVLLSFLLLRYYQTTLHIEKQYTYIHRLEESLSMILGRKGIISRESTAYKTEKGKVFRYWTWLSFTIVYPVMILFAVVFMQVIEWHSSGVQVPNRVFDLVVALIGSVTVVLYLGGVWWGKIKRRGNTKGGE